MPPLPIQYADYAVWQRHRLRGENLARELEFWRDHLTGAPPLLDLPIDYARPAVLLPRGAAFDFQIEGESVRLLQEFGRARGATPFMTFLAAFAVLLSRYANQSDLTIGTPIDNREGPQTGPLIGFFVNTLALRVRVKDGRDRETSGFGALLDQVRQTALQAYAHGETPFEKVVERLQPERDVSRSPLFQAFFTLETESGEAGPMRLPGLSLRPETPPREIAKFELTLSILLQNGRLSGSFEYNTSLFRSETIGQMARHFTNLIEHFSVGPESPLTQIDLKDAREKSKLRHWCAPDPIVFPNKRLIEQIADNARQWPDRSALMFPDTDDHANYAELDDRANRLAGRLRALGAGPETVVAVLAERGPATITALLAILKCGAVFAPLDPNAPLRRQEYILADSRPRVLIATEQNLARARVLTADPLLVAADGSFDDEARSFDGTPAPRTVGAYLIYTSGSTGRPKGVLVDQQAIADHIHTVVQLFKITEQDRFLEVHALFFDASLEGTLTALSAGAQLVVRGESIWDAADIARVFDERRITIVNMPTSYWRQIIGVWSESPARAPKLATLRIMFAGAEEMPATSAVIWRGLGFSGTRLFNAYGPTEAVITATFFEVDAELDWAKIPIGRANPGRSAAIADASLEATHLGSRGELVLGGAGLARGYLNRPDLTAELFTPDPFSEQQGARCYKTGDLVRHQQDGAIVFLGRIDGQFKLRGFRIEPGEIQNALEQHPAVEASLVLVRGEASHPRLTAYLVLVNDESEPPSDHEFRKFLDDYLPAQMIPSAFVRLDAFPLLATDKIDTKALPDPDFEVEDDDRPRTRTEEILASLWARVLDVEDVSVHADFFALGGHSLTATRLVSFIRTTFKIEIPLLDLFRTSVLAAQASLIDGVRSEGIGLNLPNIEPAPRDNAPPLSFAQQRLWVIDRLFPDRAVYNLPIALRLRGPLDLAALGRAVETIVRRHETLRTTFSETDGRSAQIIGENPATPIAFTDLAHLDADQQRVHAERATLLAFAKPFDLERGPLLRLLLIRLDREHHILAAVMHHIVSDGWSIGLLTSELTVFYNAFLKENATEPRAVLADLPIQYADFALWQQRYLSGDALAAQRDFWMTELAGAPPFLDLITDFQPPEENSFAGGSHGFVFSAQTSSRLREIGRNEGATLFMTLLAAFDCLLYRYSGQNDFCIATPNANRNRAETEPLIGFFINPLILRARIAADQSFRTLLARVRDHTLGAFDNQDFPFEQLVDALQPERQLNRNPLAQISFNLDNAPTQRELGLAGVAVEAYNPSRGVTQWELNLSVIDFPDGMVCNLEYATDLFHPRTIERMAGHLTRLVHEIVNEPDKQIARLDMLAEAERREILVDWNRTEQDLGPLQLMHALFEAQAAKTPLARALLLDGPEEENLTYADLDALANRLAHRLIELGAGPESRIGLCLERGFDLIAAMLAALKIGGAYVPLDPDYPAERLAFMARDASMSVLIAEPTHAALFQDQNIAILDPTAVESEQRFSGAAVEPSQTAYVIYTSGSTGAPKGVAVPHRAIANRVLWMNDVFPLNPEDKVLQKTAAGFDASGWEIFAPLFAGAAVALARPGGQRDPAYLIDAVRRLQVTRLQVVPTLLKVLIDEPTFGEMTCLTHIFSGGEALPRELKARVRALLDVPLINLYGPTEAAIDATYHPHGHEPERDGNVPIGNPIANANIYLLDRAGEPVPIGVPGEIHIGGLGLARGYLGRPDLTAEKFTPKPFAPDEPGARLYRTGDRARRLTDGALSFLGRIDSQVKLRGFRIELGEIDAVLGRHPAIGRAMTLIRPDRAAQPRLTAYLVKNPDAASGQDEDYAAFLRERLPDYMVPAFFVNMDAFPLLPNGKIDVKSLPSPDESARPQVGSAPPTTENERLLVQIWTEVLGLAQIGIHDNFFELGGDSILNIQIIARARQAGLLLTPKQLFEAQTIAQLAALAGTAAPAQTVSGPVTGTAPLTPAQAWFFEHYPEGANHYNQAVLLALPATVDPDALRQVLAALVSHHDALRLRVARTEDQTRCLRFDPPDGSVSFVQEDLSGLEGAALGRAVEEAASRIQTGMDLVQGPLIRLALFRTDQHALLLLAAHHMVVDGVSWRILLDDFQTGHQQISSGKPIRFPEKTTSYKEWAEQLVAYAASSALQSERAFWLDPNHSRARPLPIDLNDAADDANTLASARDIRLSLTEEETGLLLREVPKSFHSRIDEALAAALARTLADWTQANWAAFEMEGHGREDILEHADVSRTVGWFTSLYPVLLEADPGWDPGALLKSVKERMRSTPNRGIGHGLLRFMAPDPETRTALQNQPRPGVVFNYLGQVDALTGDASLFRTTDASSGPAIDPELKRTHLLEITAIVEGGQLTVAWTYSPHFHTERTVARLARRFLDHLSELIRYCAQPGLQGYTPSDFPLAGLDQSTLDRLLEKEKGVQDLYRLSPMQEGLLYHAVADNDPTLYLVLMACTFHAPFDPAAFKQSWSLLLARYPIFRTAFRWKDLEDPVQIVFETVDLPWREEDWRDAEREGVQERIDAFLRADRERGMAVDQAPLMRFSLIRLTDDAYYFAWLSHHLLMDGWAIANVMKEFFQLYQSLIKDQPLTLPSCKPYRDYIAWLETRDQAEAERYWRDLLAGFSEPTPPPAMIRLEPLAPGEEANNQLKAEIDADRTSALGKLARTNRETLNSFAQAAWAILLARCSGSDDVVFGSIVSGRPPYIPGVEEMVGLFINNLPVRARIEAGMRIGDLTAQLRKQLVEHDQFAYTPLSTIRRHCEIPGDQDLFTSIFAFENYPVDESISHPSDALTVSDPLNFQPTNYPLAIAVSTGEVVAANMTYDATLFDEPAIARILAQYLGILAGFLEGLDKPLAEVCVATLAEREQILKVWNNTSADYGPESRLHRLFEAQAERTPEAAAIIADHPAGAGETLSYAVLDKRANHLAALLLARGARPETLIGLCVERGCDMVVGLLGILKTGAAYLPLDPTYPRDRLAAMMTDAAAPILLTQDHLDDVVPDTAAEKLVPWSTLGGRSRIETWSDPEHTAYVIYTSGSTGAPKGVAIPHAGIANRVLWTNHVFPMTGSDTMIQKTPIGFDAAGWELYAPLLAGARLVLAAPDGHRDPAYLTASINRHRVNRLQVVPTLLRMLLDEPDFAKVDCLTRVFSGGEALDAALVARFYADHRAELINLTARPRPASMRRTNRPNPVEPPASRQSADRSATFGSCCSTASDNPSPWGSRANSTLPVGALPAAI